MLSGPQTSPPLQQAKFLLSGSGGSGSPAGSVPLSHAMYHCCGTQETICGAGFCEDKVGHKMCVSVSKTKLMAWNFNSVAVKNNVYRVLTFKHTIFQRFKEVRWTAFINDSPGHHVSRRGQPV